jgi:hypothetical protein
MFVQNSPVDAYDNTLDDFGTLPGVVEGGKGESRSSLFLMM